MLAFLLLAGVLQQQPGQAPAPAPAGQAAAASFDSTTQLVVAVGYAVADVKGSLDLFQREVFNGLDGDVVASAAAFERDCHALDVTALMAARKICRHCGSPDLQRALEGYRAIMPTLARTGARCSARIDRLLQNGSQHVEAERLRHDVGVIASGIVAGFVPYERRLQVLRVAAGWASPAPGLPSPRN